MIKFSISIDLQPRFSIFSQHIYDRMYMLPELDFISTDLAKFTNKTFTKLDYMSDTASVHY